jgi:hypothetical protein
VTRPPGRANRLRRAGLAGLGLVNLCWGGWAVLAPAGFFAGFPGFGYHWTGGYPPYNGHLITDLGITFVTLGVLLLTAAVLDDRRVTSVVLAGDLVWSGLHLVYHALHRGELDTVGYQVSLVSLVLGVLAPLGLLVLNRRPR